MSSRPILPPWASTLVIVLIGIGVAGVFWNLIEQNRDLRQALLQSRAQSGAQVLESGVELVPFRVTDMDGEPDSFTTVLDRAPALVYFFTTTCPYCEATLPVWRDLSEQASALGLKTIGIALDSRNATHAYIAEMGVAFPVWVVDDLTERQRSGAASVPQTVLVSASGVVKRSWLGALSGATGVEIANEAKTLALTGDCCETQQP